jgi:hypothetical protein
MGSTSINNLPYKKSVSERIDRTYLNSSPEKQTPHTDVKHQISAMTLRYEQLLSIVASRKYCFGSYRQKIEESSYANRITSFSDHNAYQDRNTYGLSASVSVITTTKAKIKTKAKSQHYWDSFLISTRISQLATSLGSRRIYELSVKHEVSCTCTCTYYIRVTKESVTCPTAKEWLEQKYTPRRPRIRRV